jgi:hypothetical protein
MKSAFTITRAGSRLFVIALTVLPFAYAAKPNPQLAQVQNVYLMPMSHGFDQYLANHLAQTGRFRVVTDPVLADAVFTDTLGAVFDARYSALYPPPPPPKEKKDDAAADKKKSQLESARETIEANERDEKQFRSSSFGRSKGNLFLVQRPSKTVIWSQYKQPRNTQPNELDKLADYFAGQLKKQAGQPAPPAPPAAAHETAVPEPAPPVSTPPAPDTPAPTAP